MRWRCREQVDQEHQKLAGKQVETREIGYRMQCNLILSILF